ncbi:MAG TPA: zinc ribbon domain-containing protein [Ruminococcus bromii]|nr:zinc ribbon domain-containing protein [Ruminococcus bromii]
MPFGATVTLIKIYSIIEIVIGGLALLAFTGITFLLSLVLQGQEVFGYILILCIFAIPIALVTLIHGIGLLLWSDSIKKGATSVYLKSRGSILLAVSSILSIIVSVASAIASFIFIKEYGPEISAYLHHLAEENPNFNFSGLFNSSDPMNSLFISAAGVVTALNTVLSAVFYALLAALAISFHTYIKKYTNGINLGSGHSPEYDAQQNAVPVPPVAPATSEVQTEGIQPPVQQPIDFQPKSVDFGSMSATSDNKQINTQFENPYMQAVADDMSDKSNTVVCPNCHAQCNNDMKFCGNCGTKLK